MDLIYQPEALPYVSQKFKIDEYFSRLIDTIAKLELFKETLATEYFVQVLGKDQETVERMSEQCSIQLLEAKRGDQANDADVEPISWNNIPKEVVEHLASVAVYKRILETPALQKRHLENLRELRRLYPSDFRKSKECTSLINEVPKEILLTVRVYNPFKYNRAEKVKPPHHMQDFLVLGSQSLTQLRDKIFCLNDAAVVGTTNETGHQITMKNLIPSAMFYFGKTFYCDFRDPVSKDYGEVIEKWACDNPGKGIGTFQHKAMENSLFNELEICFGMPYVYIHLGNCEHLVTFVDARLMSKDDAQNIDDYPLIEKVKPKLHFCSACHLYLAKWIVEDNERIPFSPAFFCGNCFLSFNFHEGGRIGTFKYVAYPEIGSVKTK